MRERVFASLLARRLLLGAAALTLVACRSDTLVEPSSRPAPAGPDLTLTGGVGTPIFPTSFDGEPQPLGFAIGLNGTGQITGGATGLTSGSSGDGNKPFRWTPAGDLVELTGCCENGFGADINASGAIVGSVEAGANAAYRPFVATGNSITFLPLLPGIPNDIDTQESHAKALALNDVVEIVGYSPVNGTTHHAVRWSASGGITDLGTLGGSSSEAVDVNNAGQIIGMSQIAGNAARHAFRWSSGTGMEDLTTLIGAAITDVVEINDAGQIVGTFIATNGASRAFRYTPGSGLFDLGTLGGDASAPTGLNGRGEVVGWSELADGATHAFLWTPSDGREDITALSGVTEVRRLNDNLQTLTVTAPPTGTPGLGRQIPRLVQLQVTQSNVAPIALFTAACNGLTCVLDASGSLDDKPGLTYAWNLGMMPNGSATGAVVTVTYPAAGSRTVTLAVTDANGLSSTVAKTFDVSVSPVAAFTVRCTGLTCSFDSSPSTFADGSSYAWEWRFGDDAKAFMDVAPTHTFAQPGTYAVSLEIQEYPIVEHAGHAILTRLVTVGTTPPANAPPVAAFTWSCASKTCRFDASTSTDDAGIVRYAWDFDRGRGRGGKTSGVTAKTTYPHGGTHDVSLTVTDSDGQSASVTHTVVAAPAGRDRETAATGISR